MREYPEAEVDRVSVIDRRPAKKVLYHELSGPFCEERLTGSGMCPSCCYNPDMDELVVRYFCPDCDVPLSQMGCPQCGHRFRKP